MATKAERLTELNLELAEIKTAITRIRTGGQSFGIGDLTNSQASLSGLIEQRTACEKSIQRLLRGGRGIPIDLSYTAGGGDVGDIE